jgi:calcium-dependent protein kinase
MNMIRQNSLAKLDVERQYSWNRQRQNSFERLRSIEAGKTLARQHSFTFRAEDTKPPANDDSMNGSQVAEWCDRHATQVAGMVSSITGGSLFLKSSFENDKLKNRAALISRHSSSSFTTRNYTTIKELGKGSFSRVQLLRDKRTGIARVLKISEGGMGTKESQMLKNEIHLLSALDHPNIVKIYEYSEDIGRGQLLMVLEYVAGGDCQQLLRSSEQSQSEAFIAKLIWQLLSVLCYCHSRGILHCDIKPENMMLTKPTRGLPDLKVIDFGLTHRIDQPSRDFVGTPSYMAPEIVKGSAAYTIKADVWSVGVTACELLASMPPFDRPQSFNGDIEPVLDNIRNYIHFQQVEARLSESENWSWRSYNSKDFVKSLIIADPAERPHADQALEHSWLQRNKSWPSFLTTTMIRSMMRFVNASPVVRRCLLIIAARMGSPDMERIGEVFLSIDDRHTGHISREDLAAAVSTAATCWEPEFDVDDFFDAADQEQKDVISFLEFVATCIWGADDTATTIAERAFEALDDDRDGKVYLDDCRLLFHGCDTVELHNLPRHRSIGINEWRVAIGGGDVNAPLRQKHAQEDTSMIGRFMRSMMCHPAADHEDDFELYCT